MTSSDPQRRTVLTSHRARRMPPERPARLCKSLLTAILLVSLAATALAAEKVKGKEEQKEIKQLIAALASPNREPHWPPGRNPAGHPPKYPRNYDHAAQKLVIAARDALVAKGFTAFPQLVESSEDGRYSYTMRDESWMNVSVGDVCRWIIIVQVEVCQPFVRSHRADFPGNTYYLLIGPYGTDLKEWWKASKHRSLREMQLEATKWVIEDQTKRGFKYEEEKVAVLGGLARLRRRLESSNDPIRVDSAGGFINEPDLKPIEWESPPRQK